MTVTRFEYPSAEGLQLSVRDYQLVGIPRRGTLLMVHGVCEHGGRYEALARAATARGWRVVIPDLRGHGVSQGVRVYARHIDEYLNDLRRLLEYLKLSGDEPLVLVGHSFGGLLVARWLQREPTVANAAVLLCPYLRLRLKVDGFTWWAGRFLAWAWPRWKFRSRVRARDLTHDEAAREQRRRDSLISRTVTAGWFFAAQLAIQDVWREVSRWQTPVAIYQAGADPVVEPEAAAEWFQKLPLTTDRKQLVLLPDHLHELLQEPDHDQTLASILDWFDVTLTSNTTISPNKKSP